MYPELPFQSRKYKKQCVTILHEIRDLIDRYGETGFGDKPNDLTPVQYWLQHLPSKDDE